MIAWSVRVLRREDMLTVVVEELFDEVDVREDHPPAAIALQLELIKRISVGAERKTVAAKAK